MRLSFLFLLSLFSSLGFTQTPSIKIIYENDDAFNTINRRPQIAQYLATIDGVQLMQGKERYSLRLFETVGLYTTDSVFIADAGNKAKSWRLPVVHIRDYPQQQRYSVYPDLKPGTAYQEACKDGPLWIIDRSQTKRILGMTCYYATKELKETTHQIWFTNELSFQDGPFSSEESYACNLPGLVLEHTFGNGYTTRAVDIQFTATDPELGNKVRQLVALDQTTKPTYSPNQAGSEWLLLINQEIRLQEWVPIEYPASLIMNWLK